MALQDRDYWKERNRTRPTKTWQINATASRKKQNRTNYPRIFVAFAIVVIVWMAVAGKLLNTH